MSEKCHKMDPEAKALWVKALRSNKYKQCRQVLAIQNSDGTDSYCALGVLMNELGTGDWELGTVRGRGQPCWKYVDGYGGGGSISMITPEFIGVIDYYARDRVVSMNDRGYKSFAEIADWIEENL